MATAACLLSGAIPASGLPGPSFAHNLGLGPLDCAHVSRETWAQSSRDRGAASLGPLQMHHQKYSIADSTASNLYPQASAPPSTIFENQGLTSPLLQESRRKKPLNWYNFSRVFTPRYIRVGGDLWGAGALLFRPENSWYHASLEAGNLVQMWVLEGTRALYEAPHPNDYASSSWLMRVGMDVNFLNSADYVIFLGLRYGMGVMRESMRFQKEWEFGTWQIDVSNQRLGVSWIGVHSGLRLLVWKNVFMGITFQMNFAKKVQGDREFASFQIPGVGPLDSANVLTQFYAYWKFDFGRD